MPRRPRRNHPRPVDPIFCIYCRGKILIYSCDKPECLEAYIARTRELAQRDWKPELDTLPPTYYGKRKG